MLRRGIYPVLLTIGLLAGLCGCSKEDADRNKATQAIDPAAPNAIFINAIRGGKLVNFPSVTIGEAFDAYKHLVDKEWKATPQAGRLFAIDFTGWFTSDGLNEQDRRRGIMRKGLDVTFVVNVDGAFSVFMVSMIEANADGSLRRRQINDVDGVLTKIYGNKKIEL
jgi:hypothetical protein